jgi:hypothetical protein
MGLAYRAATRQELDWQDLRAAIAALVAMANLDQGLGADARLDEIETRLWVVEGERQRRPPGGSVVSPIMRRILEIERMIEEAAAVETCERPVHEMKDAECVTAWHKLCHRRAPGEPRPAPMSPEEEAAVIAAWRELTA